MNIHMTAVCGMGMGSLAGLLRATGHRVSGSDANCYPPMSTQLERLGIAVMGGFCPSHIPPDTDLVIVGNAVRSDNPEVLETARRGIRSVSFPQALAEMFLAGRTSVVVAGTHGKTTTCALIAWILHHAGLAPGFLIGGVLCNFDASSAPGGGPHFVVEGDEYHAAPFDRRPKFMHYRPRIGVLTSVDFDHADIFSGIEECAAAFRGFAALIPADGRLIACADDDRVREVSAASAAPVETYGFAAGARWRILDYEAGGGGARFTVARRGGESCALRSPLAGRHNARNAAAAFAAARSLGLPPAVIAAGIEAFRGVRRRQEVRGVVGGVAVIDDFAHHPTEVAETIAAVRERYPGRRLWAVWEPRTNSSRRNVFQENYPAAFDLADRVVVADVYLAEQIEAGRRFSPGALVAALRARGVDARHVGDPGAIADLLAGECAAGDVVLVMSNGSFGRIHERLLEALRARGGAGGGPGGPGRSPA
ncbi:MAG: UDP-N-acetylmuramate--L-alanine ligase [bacterium]|nr:UDP-N-acetylmuramate--L-alanine ligase [bacterium]